LGGYLKSHVRPEDIPSRYGGEEFTLVLPGASCDIVRTRAESLRKGFRGVPLDRGSGIDKGQRTISLSFGVAVFPDNGQSVEGLLRAANEALYRAKMDGKIAWWWLKAVRRRRLTPHNSRFDRERRQAFN